VGIETLVGVAVRNGMPVTIWQDRSKIKPAEINTNGLSECFMLPIPFDTISHDFGWLWTGNDGFIFC
jgi:hypothetical protein